MCIRAVSSIIVLKLQHKAVTVCHGYTHRPRCCRGSYATPQQCWPDIKILLYTMSEGDCKPSLSAVAQVSLCSLYQIIRKARTCRGMVLERAAPLQRIVSERNREEVWHAMAYVWPRIQVLRGPARSARPPRPSHSRVSPNFKICEASGSERAKQQRRKGYKPGSGQYYERLANSRMTNAVVWTDAGPTYLYT